MQEPASASSGNQTPVASAPAGAVGFEIDLQDGFPFAGTVEVSVNGERVYSQVPSPNPLLGFAGRLAGLQSATARLVLNIKLLPVGSEETFQVDLSKGRFLGVGVKGGIGGEPGRIMLRQQEQGFIYD
jgi:hypothetical protein